MSKLKQELLRGLPSISALLDTPTAQKWCQVQPIALVADCLRQVVEDIRKQILEDSGGRCGPAHITEQYILTAAQAVLDDRIQPHIRAAINATGIILHTGLGRSVFPETVVDSVMQDLKGYVTLAVDRTTGTHPTAITASSTSSRN